MSPISYPVYFVKYFYLTGFLEPASALHTVEKLWTPLRFRRIGISSALIFLFAGEALLLSRSQLSVCSLQFLQLLGCGLEL